MSPILHMAPLHGVTNQIFRNAFLRHFSGIDAFMAPFIASIHSENTYAKGRRNHFKDILPESNSGVNLIPQIMSNDAASFVETAKTMADYGYREVNWNLGCPFPMVTNKQRGSGLLPYPDRIRQFLEEACPAVPIDISVKVRLGYGNPREILALVPIFNGFPLKLLIIHPRIGTQMYEGSVDLDGFAAALAISKTEVMYNGDIKDLETFKSLAAKFPTVRQWMIGRWAVADPFLPAMIQGIPRTPEPLAAIRSFHDDLYSSYRAALSGPKHLLDKMKEIWTYLGQSLSHAERPLKELSRAKTIESYLDSAGGVFSESEWKG